MKIDFVEIKTKIYKKKAIVISIITILFIILFSLLGIKAAEAYNKKLMNIKILNYLMFSKIVQKKMLITYKKKKKQQKM